MIKYHNIEQKTDDWYAIRKGKFTASNAQAIGNAGKGLESYVVEVLASKMELKSDAYTNDDMDRGVELEEKARMFYEKQTNTKVKLVGFVTNDKYENVGCSPDGLVGKNGLIEIKCPNNINFFKLMLEPTVKPEYMWQIQMQLLITERKWCDYVCYNENFEKKMVVIRVFPDADMQNKLIAGFEKGNQLLIELTNKIYDTKN